MNNKICDIKDDINKVFKHSIQFNNQDGWDLITWCVDQFGPATTEYRVRTNDSEIYNRNWIVRFSDLNIRSGRFCCLFSFKKEEDLALLKLIWL